jgi:hypothetical protein
MPLLIMVHYSWQLRSTAGMDDELKNPQQGPCERTGDTLLGGQVYDQCVHFITMIYSFNRK